MSRPHFNNKNNCITPIVQPCVFFEWGATKKYASLNSEIIPKTIIEGAEMERMIVVVFDNEVKAYNGSRALNELDAEGSISVHAKAVVEKKAKGKLDVKAAKDEFPIRTVGGTAIGALLGLLGGPIGIGIGGVTGTFAGFFVDMYRSGVSADFLDDVSNKLTPGKWAVVADINEDWETPLDTRMKTLGGTVFRTERHDYEREQDADYVASVKAHIALLKSEHAESHAENKAKIQAKIDNLNKKLHAKLKQAKQRSREREKETKTKIEALKKKASGAKGDPKAKIEARISEIRDKEEEANAAYQRWLRGEDSREEDQG